MGVPALPLDGFELFTVPLIMVIARFPLVLDKGDGGIEVGFDSCVLMFLLCTLHPQESLLLWALGVLGTQLTNDKRTPIKLFNIGIGITGGALAAVLLTVVRGGEAQTGSPRELIAVTVAATAYFTVDFVVSAVSVSLEDGSPVRDHLVQRGTIIAILCFVPLASLGYLAAVMVQFTPLWTLVLLAVPLVTLLIATRAVTRGSENARRLEVLFEAAVRAQTLSDTRQVVDALIDDARRLLRINQVEVRSTPPAAHEIGAQLQDGQRDRWLVAPGRHRARSTQSADQQALEAMVAVSSDAFARLRLTDDMTHLARHDLLTNLPNRGLLLDRVEHALQLSRRRGSRVALLFVDLDGFKPVNDRFGHAAGDAVLIDFAQRLTTCVRASDTVARLGGDEFAILLEDVRPIEVDSAAERILKALSAGAHVAGHQLSLSASVGVAFGEPTRHLGEPAPQRRPRDVRGQGAREEPVRHVRGRARQDPPAAARARRGAPDLGGGRRAEPGLPAGGAGLHRPDHRRRGAGPLELERRGRPPGHLHQGRRGERARRRTRRRGARPGSRGRPGTARGLGR